MGGMGTGAEMLARAWCVSPGQGSAMFTGAAVLKDGEGQTPKRCGGGGGCDLNIWGAEAGRSQVQSQAGESSETLEKGERQRQKQKQ